MPNRYLRWGIVGRLAWWWSRPTKWQAYFRSLKRQVNKRGPISADVWQTPLRRKIANDIELILSDACWGERLSFHPDDSWLVIGEWEIGDLSELDAVFRIEKRFGVELPRKELGERIMAGLTFGELVTIIEEQGTQLTA
ncbi:MAG: hypothetical protein ISR77_28560 [Pirellulaceae bacterium]|nr:hypothetical protein [Pirellulaceae bacterium]